MQTPALLLLAAALLAFSGGNFGADSPRTARQPPSTLAADGPGWNRLEFRAQKFGFTATSSVELERTPAAKVAWELGKPGTARERGGPLVQLTFESTALGDTTGERVWLDPATGASLESTSWRRGSFKVHRYDGPTVLFERRKPAGDAEKGAPASAWTDRWSHDYPVPKAPGLVVADPATLLYSVATAPLQQVGDTRRLLAFDREGSNEVRLEVKERLRIPVTYERHRGGEVTRNREEVEVLRIALSYRPLGPGGGGDTRFLGLKGNLEIFLDPALRLPVKVSGKSAFGHVDVLLDRAFLDPSSGR